MNLPQLRALVAVADTAYQGYDKDHPDLDIPYKLDFAGAVTLAS